MLNELDGSPLGLADQLGEPLLAFDQRQLAQVVAVVLDQVEGVEHHRVAGAPGAQRMEVRPSVIADNYRLAVDQERRCLDAACGFDNGREAVGPVMAVAREAADPRAIPAHHQPIAVMFDFVNP